MKLIGKLSRITLLASILLAMPLASYAYHSPMINKYPTKPIVIKRTKLVRPTTYVKKAIPKRKWQIINFPSVSTVYLEGDIDLKLISKQSRCKLVVNRLNNYPPGLKYNDGVLTISKSAYSAPPNTRLQLVLYVNQICNLFITGNSRVYGHDIASYCYIDIVNCGNGAICLTGSNKLRHLQNTGNACITIHGICNDHVEVINTHYGVVRLYGDTDALLIRSVQNSFTDARCLRAHTSFVQTEGNAIVYVRAVNSLRAFAAGCSTIFYFSTPCDLVKHTTTSGNIFQFADW